MTPEPEYTTGTWSGKPNFQCASCPYSDLNEGRMKAHVAARHRLPTAVPVQGRLFDPSGAPITQRPLTEEEQAAAQAAASPTEGATDAATQDAGDQPGDQGGGKRKQ